MGDAEALAWWDGLVLKTVWCTTMQGTYSLHGKQLRKISARANNCIAGSKAYIVRSIAVIIHSTEKGCGSISTNVLSQKVPAARMFIKEVGHIMDETSNADQRTRLSLRLVYAPRVNDKRHASTLVTHSSPS